MIEQKLQDKIEDVAAVALQDSLQQTEIPAETLEPVETVAVEPVEETIITDGAERTQVAGITSALKNVITKFDEKVEAAEKNVVPGISPEAVFQIGDNIVIREIDPVQAQAIDEAFGGEYSKSLNLPAILEATGEFNAADYFARFKDANADLIESARRGTITVDMALQYAMKQDIGGLVKSWLGRNPGQPANMEDFVGGLVALDGVMTYTDSLYARVDEIDAIPNMTPELMQEREQLLNRARKMITVQGELGINLQAAVSEGARTTAAAGVLKRRGLPDAMRRGQEIAELMQSPAYQDTEFLRQSYGALRTRDAKLAYANKLMEGGKWTYDIMLSTWMNSMLSSFTTHAINIAGNASLQGLDLLETFVAAGISKTRRAGASLVGRSIDPQDQVYASQAVQKVVGIRKALLDSFYVALNTMITEQPYDMATKLDISRRRQIGKTGDFRQMAKDVREGHIGSATVSFLGSLMRLPGRALMAEDEFFKGIAYRASLHEQAENAAQAAKQRALKEGATIDRAEEIAIAERARVLDDPPVGVTLSAQEASQQLTLTNELKGFFRTLQSTFSVPILKQFLPFVTAPLNDYSQTLQRVPILNFASSQFRSDFFAGGARRDKAVAKMFTASGIAATTVAFVDTGFGAEEGKLVVTGAGPKDFKARMAFERMGFQPYSFNVLQEDGKTYKSYSYMRLGPVSGVLAMSSDYNYYSQFEQDYDQTQALAHAMVLSGGEYLVSNPYLQSIKEIMEAARSSDVETMLPAVLDKLAESQGNFVLSTIPGNSAFGRSFIRSQDPTIYSTLIPAEGMFGEIPQEMPAWTHPWYEALQKQSASNWIFNQREGLYPQLNIWGEERKAGTPGIHQMYNPFRVREAKWTPIDKEIVRLGKGLPNFPDKYKGVKLTDEQMYRWTILSNTIDSKRRLPGQAGYDEQLTLKPRLARRIVQPSYRNLTDRDKRFSKFSSLFNDYKALGWNQLLQEFPDLERMVDEAEKPTPVPTTMVP